MIRSFRENYFFLSNFYLTEIRYKNHVYKSVEHAFQAAKCLKLSDHDKIRNAETPKAAKILGRFVELKPNWDVDRIKVMESILRIKFRKAKLRRLLRETGNMDLIEENFWHDTFWSVCACTKHVRTGQNMLGKILMKIRFEISRPPINLPI